jgi:hypothetical protein
MFRQRRKDRKRATTCSHPKHLFGSNKARCLCGSYYKENGRIFRIKGDSFVAGTTADFQFMSKKPTKKTAKRKLRWLLRQRDRMAT